MSRPFRRKHLELAHSRLNDWSYWLSKVTDLSPLGASAIDLNGSSGGSPGPICPECMTPRKIRETEVAFERQSPRVQWNIHNYYFADKKKVTKAQREHFLKRIADCLFG